MGKILFYYFVGILIFSEFIFLFGNSFNEIIRKIVWAIDIVMIIIFVVLVFLFEWKKKYQQSNR